MPLKFKRKCFIHSSTHISIYIGNKDWAKIHKKNFDKFDSIDVYLDKKKQRADEITASVKKAKNILAEVQASVNKLKSHKTPTRENLVST